MKISKIILIIILFIAFFEIGLFSSYTIVTSEVPDIEELITMQTDVIGSIFSSDTIGSVLVKDPTELNVTNKLDLADVITKKANVDGVNVDNITITTINDLSSKNITINITTFGFSAPSTSSGQIIISSEPDYKITAYATAFWTSSGFCVDLESVKISSILKMYNSTSNQKSKSNYDGGVYAPTKKYNSYSDSSSKYYSSSSSKSYSSDSYKSSENTYTDDSKDYSSSSNSSN